ncbi:MAG: cytochrome-c oxidase, cbb3-type subunit I [Polyangiaceae bacterium]|nr:cytochrome-c oxidase, cbb3-type subunit I [Polyangiaceae bacterium]
MTVKSPAAIEAAPLATRTRVEYDDAPARWFVGASVVWALVALLAGAVIALQLAFPGANVHAAFAYGRLRPLHTNAAIFAFVGNMIFAGVYYSTQRLVKARLPSALLSKIHFWGWQGIIVAAAISLPLGMTQAKEYAELEWPIDLAIAVVWIAFAINFFWTLARRAEKHLYVAIWFYIATIVTITVLHVVNSLAVPIAATKSYSIFGGAQDALVQWWYGHNAVAFFLTTPILGIMYYFVPKAAGRPVYSYRLSIIHFWALVFLYIWAGPHHLLNTALPEWAQTLGMIFSLMLWAPSWGGMINGLLTLRGAWSKLRTDPVLKFFAAGLTFYGMATFEGPLLSIRSVSSLAHYTDWIVGHVHAGALGWNGFMAAGMFYWMVPRLFGTKLHSTRLADMHFWIGTVGILLYVISMWVSGVTQGLMWRAQAADGSLLYPSFVETVIAIKPLYWTRLAGGLLYLAGMIMMAYNLAKTARAGQAVNGSAEVVVQVERPGLPWQKLVFGRPVVVSGILIVLAIGVGTGDVLTGIAWMTVMAVVGGLTLVVTALSARGGAGDKPTWHRILEGRALVFTVLTILAVLVGGVVQIVPMVLVKPTPKEVSETRLATALEIEGRDIYLREGCYTCHSQMIRPLDFEKQRYGDPSTLNESMYDHPFQWGSKRTGPDLAREGNKNPNAWHVQHFIDPPAISEGSNMPAYKHFLENRVDFEGTEAKLRGLRLVGVPYTVDDVHGAAASAKSQADGIAKDLEEQGVTVAPDSEMVAVLAYLQSLGVAPKAPARPESPTLASGQ